MYRRAVISGYFGFGNTGDELILLSVVRDLKKIYPATEILVLSKQPSATSAEFNVKSAYRWNVAKVFLALGKKNILICAGGLLQDTTSTRNCLYYLLVILLGIFRRSRVIVFGGIGPLKNRITRRITAYLLDRTYAVVCRDKGSMNLLNQLGVKNPKIIFGADPVLGMKPDAEGGRKRIEELTGITSGIILGVVLRNWQTRTDFSGIIARGLYLLPSKYRIILIPFQPADEKLCRSVAEQTSGMAKALEKFSPAETAELIAGLDILVGMRLHSIILAAVSGVPFIAVSYDPKIENFVSELNAGSMFRIDELSPEKLSAGIESIHAKSPELRQAIKAKVGILSARLLDWSGLLEK